MQPGGIAPMTTKVIMPQMGESVFEGTLTKWLKKAGDAVVQDEPLFEISTDKVDSEVPSPASGILSEILVPEGKTIQINTVLAIIEESGAKKETAQPAPSSEEAPPAPTQTKEPERKAKQQEEAPEPEKPKKKIAPAAKTSSVQETVSTIRVADIRTSPLVRKIARENNVDLSEVRGTALEGRITKEDILNYLAKRPTPGSPQPSEPVPSAESEPAESEPLAPAPAEGALEQASIGAEAPRFMGESETVPMTVMRKAIAEHMVLSKRTSAHVNTVFEVDMTAVVRLRESHKTEFQKREGIPLTYTPFFAKALVDNVREFPVFNASISAESIIYKKPVNIGIAVALETGLIVPVIPNAHLKSFTGLALAIHDLAERARSRKLKPDDVKNGTISMTNPGSFGALFNTPIISQPQVAILGVGGIEKRPVVVNDAIAIRSMVCLSLTFDHRLIDGAVADQFMAKLKERLQGWNEWTD
jgi:pyruvate dehydrogenase E2 component (dihydrolipoamide acetyltransferase)